MMRTILAALLVAMLAAPAAAATPNTDDEIIAPVPTTGDCVYITPYPPYVAIRPCEGLGPNPQE